MKTITAVLATILMALLTACSGVSTDEYLNGDFINIAISQNPTNLIDPTNKSVLSENPTFIWTYLDGAKSYTVQISDKSDFSNLVLDKTFANPSTTTYTLNNVDLIGISQLDAIQYYWRVIAHYEDKAVNSVTFNFYMLGQDAVYVDVNSSASISNGSKIAPFKTIQSGIDKAFETRKSKVYVAKGTYSETKIIMRENVSIFGGYEATNWTRDININTTTIEAVENIVIYCNSTITSVTTIDGFTLQTNNDTTNYGIFLNGGSPTITNNTINAGDGTYSYGIYASSSSAVIQNNTINAGSVGSGGYSYAIYNYSSSPNISNNTLDGGTGGSYSYGITNETNSSPSISNNTITGGSGLTISYGIYSRNGSSPSISNNTISGGTGGSSYGIYNTNNSSPSISNNSITGGNASGSSYGISNLFSSSPSISNNRITGGRGISNSYGINNSSSSPTISLNTITGGSTGTNSCGIYNSSSSPTISHNTIHGGKDGTFSYSIYNNIFSAPSISNNTIASGSGSLLTYSIYDSYSASPSIDSNILYAEGSSTRYGVYEGNTVGDPTSVRNNAIFDTGSGGSFAQYYDIDGGCTANNDGDGNNQTCNITDFEALSDFTSGASNNVNATGMSQIFMYYPTEIVYTGDGNLNFTYDGNSTTLEVSSGDCGNFTGGEFFEYFYDNTLRQITAVDCVTNMTVTFTPAISYDFGAGVPILRWGTSNTNYDKKYGLKSTSPSFNQGLGATCPGGYSSKTHVWGTGTSQADCDSKYPYAGSTYNGGNCESTYLYPAVEILDDSIGNDNGLCESGETCLENPNMGSYAGHGSLTTGCDVSSVISGITMMKYSSNGYP